MAILNTKLFPKEVDLIDAIEIIANPRAVTELKTNIY